MEPDDNLGSHVKPERVVRTVALMAASVLAIGFATLAYLHPQASSGPTTRPASRQPQVVMTRAPEAIYTISLEGNTRVLATSRDGGVEWKVVRLPVTTP